MKKARKSYPGPVIFDVNPSDSQPLRSCHLQQEFQHNFLRTLQGQLILPLTHQRNRLLNPDEGSFIPFASSPGKIFSPGAFAISITCDLKDLAVS